MSGFVERWFPGLARRYYTARLEALHAKRYYEAADPTPQHPLKRTSSADAVNDRARDRLTQHARVFDENSDIAVGVLDTLCNRIVGAGLMPAPMVLTRGGELHEDVNREIAMLLEEWAKRPDTTEENHWFEVQRLLCRSWLRDGEVLIQHVAGGGYPFRPGALPYLIQPLESDFLPYDLIGSDTRNIVHGVEKTTGGRPITYFILRDQPNAVIAGRRQLPIGETIAIAASQIEHLKFQRRLHQTRGVSILHAVLRTIEDVKEGNDSERIAARVNAALCAVIQKSGVPTATQTSETGQRFLEMEPGIIMDTLLPGESVSMVGSSRPNPQMESYTNGQLRRVAAATQTGYSSISRNYDASYSAMRQETQETNVGYQRLFNYFAQKAVSNVYERMLDTAMIVGRIRMPRDADPRTITAHAISMPPLGWIDPLKEVQADALAVEEGFTSRHAVIRARHGDPRRVDAERDRDMFERAEPAPQPQDTDDENASDDDQENAA